MAGLSGMHEMGGGPGAGQGGGNLVGDMPGFADAHDDDASGTVEDQFAGGEELLIDATGKTGHGMVFKFNGAKSAFLQRGVVHDLAGPRDYPTG